MPVVVIQSEVRQCEASLYSVSLNMHQVFFKTWPFIRGDYSNHQADVREDSINETQIKRWYQLDRESVESHLRFY